MQQEYIVLRTLVPRGGTTRGGRTRGPDEAAPLRPQLDTLRADVGAEREIGQDEGVEAVAAVMPMRLVQPRNVRPQAVPTPAAAAWGIQAVGADQSRYDGQDIRVAVLDTGIARAHPAFAGVGFTIEDFTGEGAADDNGHGTHCAATIFGRAVDGMRIGVAPGVRDVLIGKVLGRDGSSSARLAKAVLWAAEQRADIVCMSLAMDFPGFVRTMVEEQGLHIDLATSRALETYGATVRLFDRLADIVRAMPHAPLLIAAAGNESRCDSDPSYEIAVAPPALADGIISVGALGPGPRGWRAADFSNTGAVLCAPGVDVLSADWQGSGLATMSGTSMAAPHVAGVAALWAHKARAAGKPVRATDLAARLQAMATEEGLEPGYRPRAVGAGLVQSPRQ